MGEAKLRAERRREAWIAAEQKPQYDPKVPRVRLLDAVAVDAEMLRTEYEAFKKRSGYGITERGYAEALLAAALERERQSREAVEERERTKDNLIVPATHLPQGMAEAAARLEKLKRG
jgi:hypothetical protein